MRWSAGACAEIARGADQTRTKVVLPDAIDHHAREQRIVRAGQPFSQRLAASGGFGVQGWIWHIAAAERRWKARAYFVARRSRIAAERDIGPRRAPANVNNSRRHGGAL